MAYSISAHRASFGKVTLFSQSNYRQKAAHCGEYERNVIRRTHLSVLRRMTMCVYHSRTHKFTRLEPYNNVIPVCWSEDMGRTIPRFRQRREVCDLPCFRRHNAVMILANAQCLWIRRINQSTDNYNPRRRPLRERNHDGGDGRGSSDRQCTIRSPCPILLGIGRRQIEAEQMNLRWRLEAA